MANGFFDMVRRGLVYLLCKVMLKLGTLYEPSSVSKNINHDPLTRTTTVFNTARQPGNGLGFVLFFLVVPIHSTRVNQPTRKSQRKD